MKGFISILVGCLLIVFRKRFAEESIAFQNTVWGFHFGEREIAITKIGAVIAGIVAIFFGLMDLGFF